MRLHENALYYHSNTMTEPKISQIRFHVKTAARMTGPKITHVRLHIEIASQITKSKITKVRFYITTAACFITLSAIFIVFQNICHSFWSHVDNITLQFSLYYAAIFIAFYSTCYSFVLFSIVLQYGFHCILLHVS